MKTQTRLIRFLLLFGAIPLISLSVKAQTGVAINTSGASADSSAMLDVSSTTSGMLIPRMSSTERSTISNPATGLLVYQIDAPAGFWYFDGTAWTQLGAGGGGGGSTINCSTSSNSDYTIRGDGSGTWECTDALRISSSGYVSINTSPSYFYRLRVNGNVGIGSSPSSSYELSVYGSTHITDDLRVGTTSSPPSNGILSYGDIKTSYGDIIVGSSSYGFCQGSYCGINTSASYVVKLSAYSTSVYVASGARR